jgi:general secretion pathway protein A
MFLDYYHLREQPFGVTPDPRFLYLSQTHREALASLYYGVESGRGFLALIAEPGMGKTTLLFQLMERVRKSACFAFLFQTQCDSREFLRYLLADMGIDSHGHDLVEMHEQLNAALMRLKRAGMRFVLIIDEAQNLDDSVLETVRLLSDFETPSSKLMQIILSGQPQLAAKLARPSLAQLRQRIAILSRLEPFSPAETRQYIDHRLQVAGYDGGPLFTSEATAIIAAQGRGIPRNINNLCFNALSLGYALGRKKVDGEMVLEAVRDLDVEPLGHLGMPCHPESAAADEGSRLGSWPHPKADSSLPSAPLRMKCDPEGGTTCHPEQSTACHPDSNMTVHPEPNMTCHSERSEGSPQSALPPPPPLEPRSSPRLTVQSGLGHRPFRIAALAASVLACLVLFPSLWKSLGTQFDRVGASGAMPVAKSIGLNRPTLPLAVSTTPPAAKSSLVDRVLGAAARTGNPAVIVVVEPQKTLYGICVEHFGRFDNKLLEQIRALNPRITDPSHIETGQRIILPARTLTSPGTKSASRAGVEPMTSVRNKP